MCSNKLELAKSCFTVLVERLLRVKRILASRHPPAASCQDQKALELIQQSKRLQNRHNCEQNYTKVNLSSTY